MAGLVGYDSDSAGGDDAPSPPRVAEERSAQLAPAAPAEPAQQLRHEEVEQPYGPTVYGPTVAAQDAEAEAAAPGEGEEEEAVAAGVAWCCAVSDMREAVEGHGALQWVDDFSELAGQRCEILRMDPSDETVEIRCRPAGFAAVWLPVGALTTAAPGGAPQGRAGGAEELPSRSLSPPRPCAPPPTAGAPVAGGVAGWMREGAACEVAVLDDNDTPTGEWVPSCRVVGLDGAEECRVEAPGGDVVTVAVQFLRPAPSRREGAGEPPPKRQRAGAGAAGNRLADVLAEEARELMERRSKLGVLKDREKKRGVDPLDPGLGNWRLSAQAERTTPRQKGRRKLNAPMNPPPV
eukprot:Hpha_TRINITY_DN31030_c0_g1::TRINITY_DN31030_c0_g1_i2::g.64065::m.64065